MTEPEPAKDPNFKEVLSLNPNMTRGRRGIVILGCAITAVLCINCFTWIVPPPNIAPTASQPVVPPGYEGLLPVSIVAISLLFCAFMAMAFISIWTTLNPPPTGSRNHLAAILIVLAMGILGALLGAHAQGHP